MIGRRQAGRGRRSEFAGRASTGRWGFRLVDAVPGDGRRPGRASGRGRKTPAGGDRGSFTAELAAGLPALLLLLLAGLAAVNAVSTRASCLHAAREAALAAARGDVDKADGGGAAPPGAEVSVSIDGDRAQATVRAPVRTLGGRLPRITVVATAVAALEPRVGERVP